VRRPSSKRSRRWLIAALIALAAPGAAAAQDSRGQELAAIRGEIARLQARLSRVTDESRGLSGELERTELSLELQARRLEEAQAARRLSEARLGELGEAVAGLEAQLSEHRQELQRRLIDLYRLGRQGYLRLLLSVRTRRQLLPAIRALRYLARRDGALLARFLDTRAELDFERGQLLERQRERELWVDLELQRHGELDRLRRRQALLLDQLRQRRGLLSARAVRLAEKERKLSNLMDFLAGRARTPLSGQPIHDFHGVLDWPAQGDLAQGFGDREDPRYGTRVPHNGIALHTVAGTAVRVVYPGKVVFAAPFEGYGQTVVVHHSGRVFTLYAGLGRLGVRQDDILRLGQAVGSATARLYFEIREENRPVDPLDWLR
jgi:septal ring factor EnvC (AmiA/AmiB activator)